MGRCSPARVGSDRTVHSLDRGHQPGDSRRRAIGDLANRKNALDKTNAMYNKTLVKFREGVGSSLEVTQAEADLFRAQAAYTDAGYSLLSAMLDWKAALGKL